MSFEDRLRHALHHEADRVEPAADGRDRIAERIDVAERRRTVRRYGLTGLGIAALLALTLGAVAVLDDEEPTSVQIGPSDTTDPTDAPTTGPSTTDQPTTDSTTATVPPEAVFPDVVSVYGDPVDAAVAFMREYVGVPAPVAGDFRQGDPRSGEVPVRPRADLAALETLVFVRQSGDWWFVLGAETPNIVLNRPRGLESVSSPVELAGEASAFEGHVGVQIRDDKGDVLGEGFVTGSGGPERGPFAGSISFGAPTTPGGAIVLSTASAEDGSVQQATVRKVRFGTTTPAGDSCDPPAPDGDHRGVLVYFHCEEQSLVAVLRSLPEGAGPLRTALEQLLAGPTAAEEDAGMFSPFSSLSAGALRNVTIEDGLAIVDLDQSLVAAVPDGSGPLARSQLAATALQFDTVDAVELQLDGSCDAFGEFSRNPDCIESDPYP